MSIPQLLSERTLSAFIIQSALAVSQSGVQRTLNIDNIFREAEYCSLLKNEGNKACIPRCPFQASLPAWCCRDWSRGEGRAGAMGSHTERPCTPRCSSCGTSLCQGQPGSPSPAVQAEDARGSPYNFPARVWAYSQLHGEECPGQAAALVPSHTCVCRESCSQQEPRAWLTPTAMSSSHPGTALMSQHRASMESCITQSLLWHRRPAGIPALEPWFELPLLCPDCSGTRLLAEISLLCQLLDFVELQITVTKPETYFPFQGSDLNTQHPSLSPSRSNLPKAQLQQWRTQHICQTCQPGCPLQTGVAGLQVPSPEHLQCFMHVHQVPRFCRNQQDWGPWAALHSHSRLTYLHDWALQPRILKAAQLE